MQGLMQMKTMSEGMQLIRSLFIIMCLVRYTTASYWKATFYEKKDYQGYSDYVGGDNTDTDCFQLPSELWPIVSSINIDNDKGKSQGSVSVFTDEKCTEKFKVGSHPSPVANLKSSGYNDKIKSVAWVRAPAPQPAPG